MTLTKPLRADREYCPEELVVIFDELATRGKNVVVVGFGRTTRDAIRDLDSIYGGGNRTEEVATMSFLTLAFAQLWHVFNMRELTSGTIHSEVIENAFV